MYTGAIRLIKHNNYLMSLKTNHFLEILGQTIPLIIVRMVNSNKLN